MPIKIIYWQIPDNYVFCMYNTDHLNLKPRTEFAKWLQSKKKLHASEQLFFPQNFLESASCRGQSSLTETDKGSHQLSFIARRDNKSLNIRECEIFLIIYLSLTMMICKSHFSLFLPIPNIRKISFENYQKALFWHFYWKCQVL